jgi:hypothetical protein
MDGDKAVTATFSQNQYGVTVTTVGSGAVSNTPGNPYPSGQTATLRPVPAAGWSFAGWSGPAVSSLVDNGDGSWSLVMDGDKVVMAAFSRHELFLPIITKQEQP